MWLHADIRSVPDIVRHYARVTPDKAALVESGKRVTFEELDRRSTRVANAIGARGAGAGSVIAFVGKNSIGFFEVLMGATKAGCTMLPMNWRLAVAELAPIVDDAEPSLVFVDKEFEPLVAEVAASCRVRFVVVAFDSQAQAGSPLQAWCADASDVDPGGPDDPRSVALLMYTSGTTGRPKGVELSHQGLGYMRLCEHLEPALRWRPDDVLMMVMPNFHLLGVGLPIQSLYNGSTVSILPAFDPGALLAVLVRDRPSILVLAPTVIQMILDHPDAAGTDFSSLRLVMYAGSPINAQLLKRAMAQMRCEFMQFYGATESSGAISLLRPAQHDLEHEHKLRSCGMTLPLIELQVRDPAGRELPDGQIGEFSIRAPCLFAGYRNQPEATRAVVEDGWYRTGDAGYRDADGLLYLVDRVKDMIVTGGENVYSAEVEQVVQQHPAVASCAVVGAPDAQWGERVVAIVVLRKGAQATADEIRQHCRGGIAGYKVPKEVRFMEALPTSSAGKVLKRVLRDALWKGQERGVA